MEVYARCPYRSQGTLHAQLFLIKHLLVLREQMTPFGGSFSISERSLDFSRTKGVNSYVYTQWLILGRSGGGPDAAPRPAVQLRLEQCIAGLSDPGLLLIA